MKKRLLSLSLLLLSLSATAQNFNPILPDNIADPSVVKFDGVYYLYGTTDIDAGLDRMGPPVVWKSTDFVNWSFEGTLMEGIDWAKRYEYTDDKEKTRAGYLRYWAPGAPAKRGDRYYLFPTIVKPDGTNFCYTMVSDSPEGPFRFQNGDGVFFGDAPLNRVESRPVIDDIDGEYFTDDDGRTYFYWRRRFAAEIKADFSELISDCVSISTSRGGYSEGPALFKRKGIYYYLYTLRGSENYCNAYMMSTEGPLRGFKKPTSGNDIFIYSSLETGVWGPGHGNVFYDADLDKYFFLYLEYGEGGTTRQTFVNEMKFNEDGTIQTIVPDFKGVGYLGKQPKTRTNLALKATATASSHQADFTKTVKIESAPNQPYEGSNKEVTRTHTYTPANAIDASNGTRWLADSEDKNPWYRLDLGKATKVSSCELFFNFPALGHTWQLEKSLDGITWTICGELAQQEARTPHVVSKIGKARYLRVKITSGSAGLWEMRVY